MKIANRSSRLARSIRRAVTFSLYAPLGALACGGTHEGADQTPDAAPAPEAGATDAGLLPDAAVLPQDSGGESNASDGGGVVDTGAPLDAVAPQDAGNTGCAVEGEADAGAAAMCQEATIATPAACETDSTGQPTVAQCAALCGGNTACEFVVADGGPVELYCICGAAGRAPEGLTRPHVATANPIGEYFARAAHLEAASVTAFTVLARELASLDAPASLVRRARRAAAEEVRHARSMAALAHRFGAQVPEVEVAPTRARSLEEIALENEVEGCVRETYGAAVAAYQAEVARDPGVRRAMRVIAEDERHHAELGWAVSSWARSRLEPEARARLDAARAAAVTDLARHTRHTPPASIAALAGLPPASRADRIVLSLRMSVWN